MKLLIASANPVKLQAPQEAFSKVFNTEVVVEGMAVDSGISDQPMSSDETYQGALNRLEAIRETPGYDYYVAIEGGVEDTEHGMECLAWVLIADAKGKIGKGKTGTYILPETVANKLRAGEELGPAMDELHHTENIKQKQGTIGILTGGQITRTSLYTHAVILALIPFIHDAY
jgi:inosine/xanthosine triphosphatase